MNTQSDMPDTARRDGHPTGKPDRRTGDVVIADGVDEEPVVSNQRIYRGWRVWLISLVATCYALFHVVSLNLFPIETWTFRIIHIVGALTLGFLLFAGATFVKTDAGTRPVDRLLHWAGLALMVPAAFALYQAGTFQVQIDNGAVWNGIDPAIRHAETYLYGIPLLAAAGAAVGLSWFHRRPPGAVNTIDIALILCALATALYLIAIYNTPIRQATGTTFAPIGISFAATAGTLLIIELTRRVAGLALVVITAVFLTYVFVGPYIPIGVLSFDGVSWQRFFSQVYTDAGILGPTTAVSSTYIILFIIFAAFLQVSKVGDYFVNFAFAAAGRARGGPAKVAIFASGLMGMINGTSAGNVVATGSLTIPLMKKIGYPPRSAGAIEAAASTGGQIMPPIMGAGAFIMAEITGIPYTEIAVAALIPAVLYFGSIFFMVDFEARRLGMRGMRDDELPKLAALARHVYLFLPIIILITALFMGYSVIRAGTLATAAAAVVSWLSPHRMGPRAIYRALDTAGVMSVQIIAVCACAGVIVGVISLTGVGARFSSLLLGLAENSQLVALFFAMCISILLGMGMPTTAAYAVAASVVAPGLIQLGIEPLTAHFFVFYYAVVSAITPPVALASYAAAGISGANPMGTSVTSFKVGLAAFIVPFMFFYNPALLSAGEWHEIVRALVTASIGVCLLSGAVQGYFLTGRQTVVRRIALGLAAMFLIEGGILSDVIGVGLALGTLLVGRVGRRMRSGAQ